MPEIFIYLLKVNIAISLFYLGYYFLLKKLTFYSINRFYLLFSILISAVFPFLRIPSFLSKPDVVYYNVLSIEGSVSNLPQNPETHYTFWFILLGAYCLFTTLGGVKLLARLLSLYRIHLKSASQFWKGYKFNNLAIDTTPFSFLTTVYLNFEKHTEEELHTILKHEEVHTRNLHSLDVLLVEIWCIFSWFNPISWFIKKAIKVNIEFIADHEVIQQGIAHHAYQNSLLHFAIQSQNLPLANQFSFLSLRSRINMMNKKKSSKTQLGKYFLLIPIIISFLFLFGVSKANKTDMSSEIILQELFNESETLANQDSKPSAKARVHISGSNINDRDSSLSEKNPLVVIDGVLKNKGSKEIETTVPAKNIKSMTIVKGKQATSLHGDNANDGVIIITTELVDQTEGNKGKVILKRTIKNADGDSTKVTQSARALAVKEKTDIVAERRTTVELKDIATVTTGSRELIVKRNFEPSATTVEKNSTEDVQILFNPSVAKSQPLYILNGKELNPSEFKNIAPKDIKSIQVYKGESATKIYGNKGVNGVIEIKLK